MYTSTSYKGMIEIRDDSYKDGSVIDHKAYLKKREQCSRKIPEVLSVTVCVAARWGWKGQREDRGR